jgi:hypothetical protein
MFTPRGTAVPGVANRARETAFLAYATAPSPDGDTTTLCAPTVSTSGELNAARTTRNAALGASPPTWIPPIVTPCGKTFGTGFGRGLGFGVVVVAVVVVVVVVVVSVVPGCVLSVVDPFEVVGGNCAEPMGTTAAKPPAAASARALTAMANERFTGPECSQRRRRYEGRS